MNTPKIALLSLVLLGCPQEYEVIPEPPDVDPGEVTECDFTRVGDSDFYAYDCNPVFTTSDEPWAPTIGSSTFTVTEVLGHPFYQLWYVGEPTGDGYGEYATGYAVSPNGTAWTPWRDNPMLEEPSSSAWDGSGMDALQVVWDPGTAQYVKLYQGYNLDSNEWGLGVATSQNGTSWSRLPSNPVLDLGVGSGNVIGWCWPLGLTLGEVAGYTGYIAGYRTANGPCEVFLLGASDVGDWRPQDKVVLAAGDPGDWDDEGVISLAVAELDGVRHMFYVGFGSWTDHGTYRSTAEQFLGHAVSTEPGQWDRERDPVPVHTNDDGVVNSVAAVTVGSRIHLWVTDEYDGVSAVGYFLYDPDREDAAE